MQIEEVPDWDLRRLKVWRAGSESRKGLQRVTGKFPGEESLKPKVNGRLQTTEEGKISVVDSHCPINREQEIQRPTDRIGQGSQKNLTRKRVWVEGWQ